MEVRFPGLGLDLKIYDVALKIGSFEIYWYAVVICLGLVLAVLYCYRRSKLFGVKGDDFLDVVFWGFFGGIIGARAYYVAYAFDQFKDNLWQIFNFRTGGMAIYGGLIGAILVGAIACRVKKMKVLPVLDLAGMGFFIGQALGRWGNFFNQEAFGSNTTLPWGMYSPNTEAYLSRHATALADLGVAVDPTMPVHPCFFYEFLWCLAGFLILHFYTKHRRFDGEMFLLYIGWYGLGRFWIEGLRTDSLMIGRLRVSQLLAGACVVAALITWLIVKGKIRAAHDESYLRPQAWQLARAAVAAEGEGGPEPSAPEEGEAGPADPAPEAPDAPDGEDGR